MRRARAPFRNVVLLLPSPDLDRSECILRERLGFWGEVDDQLLRHRSNYELATFTVYTEGQTPEQTADEVLRRTG